MLQNFEEKKHLIRDEVFHIGNSILNANKEVLEGIEGDNVAKVSNAKDNLRNITNIINDIDNEVVTLLALFQPEARDLREVVAYLKITNEMNRAATNTKNFIKAYLSQYNNDDIDTKEVNEYSIPLLKATIAAFDAAISMIYPKDIEEIHKLYNIAVVEESKTDDIYGMVEKDILKYISSYYELSQDYLALLGGLRKLEKVADRAASIANLLLYSKEGGELQAE
jgi:phosphate transport system protein